MEMAILIAIAVASSVTLLWVIVKMIKAVKEHNRKVRIAEQEEQKRQVEATRKWREGLRERTLKNASANTSSVPPRGYETTKKYTTPSYAPSPTQSVQNSKSDDGVDLMTAMLVMNAISDFNQPHKSGGSSPIDFPKEERSSSPSFRDESPSSSWSSSSSDSSSSWSSSSDSGPSSDW